METKEKKETQKKKKKKTKKKNFWESLQRLDTNSCVQETNQRGAGGQSPPELGLGNSEIFWASSVRVG